MQSSYVANIPKSLGRENYSEWVFAADNFLKEPGTEGMEAADNQRTRAKLILTIDSSLNV